jgi:NAD(P)-dependent dehydrogenase (short-subunit alcohol dehydrogenase family)
MNNSGIYPELKGKVALVTGATRGFGRAIALRLAREGAKVIVNYRRSASDARAVVDEIRAFGGETVAFRADVGREEALDRMFKMIAAEFGRLDIAVANAANVVAFLASDQAGMICGQFIVVGGGRNIVG